MVVIKEVKTKKEIREFINFPIKLYKDSKYYVPLLALGERDIFRASHPYNKVCDTVFYNAYIDGKIVGRIQGIIQRPANEKWDQKRVRFTRFDSIDNTLVSNSLFDAVVKWAKEKGMNEIVGPLGYSDLEREGLLIEGFNELGTYEEQYNYDYYQKLIENYGFQKDVDWIEYKIYPPKDGSEEQLIRISEKMMERYNLRLYQPKTINEFIKKYGKAFFEIIDNVYSKLYGTMPLNEEIVNSLIGDFKLLVRPNRDLALILDKDDKVQGFALSFVSISDAVRRSKGHITLPFLIRFLKAKRHPKVVDLGLIGIMPEYESKGIATLLIGKLIEIMKKDNLEHIETNLMLEDNHHVLNLYKRFEYEYTKRRRCFKMDI